MPAALLPEVRDCAVDFGETRPDLFGGAIRILGIAGDQQAATIGQGCFTPGMMKSTYGTGCFALLNTGAEPVHSRNRLLTTIAYQLDGKRTYALEGAIFIAGAAVQWLRDGLHLIEQASEVNALARKADPAEQVYLVPAFVGLGAPYWDAEARGAIFGLTRNSGAGGDRAGGAGGGRLSDPRSARSDARRLAGRPASTVLRVDGGMTASDCHHAVPGRHPRRAGRPPGGDGNDGAGRGLSRRLPGRGLPRPGRFCHRPGGSTAASSRRWTRRPAPANGPAGRPPSRRTLA